MNAKKILLIFSDQNELQFIYQNLQKNGFEVNHSSELKEAERSMLIFNPDLVVINLSIPAADLKQFTSNLQQKNIKSLTISDQLIFDNVDHRQHYNLPHPRPKLLLSAIRGIMNEEQPSWLRKTDHP
jgi:DNA-binding NtrC family response regulator